MAKFLALSNSVKITEAEHFRLSNVCTELGLVPLVVTGVWSPRYEVDAVE